MAKSENVKVDLAVHRETDKAFLVETIDGPFAKVWLPKALVEQGDKVEAAIRLPVYEFEIPGWLAEREGIV